MSKIHVAVHIPSKGCVSLILREKEERIGKPFRFQNDLPGGTQLTDLLVKIAKKKDPQKMYVHIKATSVYSWHFQHPLLYEMR